MHIMTENGWKMLSPRVCQTAMPAPELYHGPLPSLECNAYIRALDRDHADYMKKKG